MEEESISGDLRYFTDMTNQKREISCYYGLRQNPKKKIQKSPEVMTKKVLFRCDDCGKGFRYEKSFTNHLKVMHLSMVYEESMDSLFKSFSLVTRKKRSCLIRNKRTSFYFSFLESRSVVAVNDEDLEVADCLIFLSKSTPEFCSYEYSCLGNKFLQKGGDFESGFLSNEQRLVEEEVTTSDTFKRPMDLLGHRCGLDQQKLQKGGDFESGDCRTEQRLLEEEVTTSDTFKRPMDLLGHSCGLDQQMLQKGSDFESGFLSNEQRLVEEEVTTSDTLKRPMNLLGHKCRLDQQKLQKGGDFESGDCRTELGVGTDSDVKMITESDEKNVQHQCKLCKKIFPSYQSLGGHQTFHRIRKCKNKKNSREETVESEDESLRCSETKRRRGNHCSIGSRNLSWVQGLGEVSLLETALENRG